MVARRDGNPFALTRLLRVPRVYAGLLSHAPSSAVMSLDFLTFGMLQVRARPGLHPGLTLTLTFTRTPP